MSAQPVGQSVPLRRRTPSALAAAAAVAALVLSSCAPQGSLEADETDTPEQSQPEMTAAESDESAEPDEDPADSESEETEASESEEPEVVAADGYWKANTLPEAIAEAELSLPTEDSEDEPATAKLEILSLNTDGEFARLVMAWLPPDEGEALQPTALNRYRFSNRLAPWARIADRQNSQLLEPLRTEGRNFDTDVAAAIDEDMGAEEAPGRTSCACSAARESRSAPDERTKLIYVDFPAPQAEEIDLLVGQWAEPLRDVPVTEGEPFELPSDDGLTYFDMRGNNQEFPQETYGAGAVYAHPPEPISARSRTLTGLTTTVEGESQEVSIPSDVLFEFGEYTLSSEAEQIIADVAEKLNEEAAGENVVIAGHTDNVDGHDINQPLSENRAEAVAEVMEPLLDESISTETQGHSFNEPLVPNEDAEGNGIPENRAINRRVSFRYSFTETSEVAVETGFEEFDELPEAQDTDTADGAIASYVLQPPADDRTSSNVRLDLVGAERDGEGLVTVRLGLADPEGTDYAAEVFSGAPGAEESQHFGKNPYSTHFDPGLGNLSIVDPEAEEQYFPLTAGASGCLCTEVAGSGTALSGQPAQLFAEFSIPDDADGPLTLRVPDAGQIELDEGLIEQMTAGSPESQE